MKKLKNILLTLLSVACIGTAAVGFAACDKETSSPEAGSSSVETAKTEIEKIYDQYVIHAQAEGEAPLSYEQWLASIKGEKGDKGDQGEKGDKGDQGEQGIQGEKGDKGDQGEQGIQGEKGDKGDTGATGTEGKSAYQIWFDKGNTGTEEDFLNWLKGLNDHTYGDWIRYTEGEDITCEQIIFYRVCATCSHIEWKHGSSNDHNWNTVTTAPTCQMQGYDTNTCTICGKVEVNNYTNRVGHAWSTEYSYDNSYHWYACGTCSDEKDKAEHTPDETGACTVCTALVGATEGVVYDLSADGTYADVIGYEGTATRVRIADTYENVPVKTIYEEAFYNNDNITSVIIPDSVTTIGSHAFYSCSSLTSIEIPDSVTEIDSGAFSDCDSLTSVEIPESVTSIRNSVFSSCDNLTSVVIPDSVTTIGENAFLYCSSLTSVVIGDSVTTIGGWAFYSCGSLTSVVIPDSVTTIGDYVFYECGSLTSVVIPDSVTSIGSHAFYNCSSLTFNEYGNCKYLGNEGNPYFALIEVSNQNYSSYTIHEDTRIIAGSAFSGCSRIAEIIIPDSVTTIGDEAFFSCSSLTSVVIPDSVTTIGEYAFSNCYSLTSVEIPDSVTSIGDWAFEYCNSLTSITFEGTVEEWNEISKGYNWNYIVPATEVVCKDGSVAL